MGPICGSPGLENAEAGHKAIQEVLVTRAEVTEASAGACSDRRGRAGGIAEEEVRARSLAVTEEFEDQ